MARVRRTETEQGAPQVQRVPLEQAANFVTIDEDHHAWATPAEEHEVFKRLFHAARGGFVRLQPPADVEDQIVAALVFAARAAGAAAVRVLPKLRRSVVTYTRAQVPTDDMRAVVTGMVEDSKSLDKPALRQLAEEIMGEVGL